MKLLEQFALKYPSITIRRGARERDVGGSSSTSSVSDLQSSNISLNSDTSAASVIKGHIEETPVLSETDEQLGEALLHIDYLVRSIEKMDHPPGSVIPAKVIQKLTEAGDLIHIEREQEVKVETALKYQRLYSMAERQQAELEWRIREVEDSQKRDGSQKEHMEGIRLLLLQEYLDKVEERNTIVRLMDDLENMEDEKITESDDMGECNRLIRG